MRDIRAENAQFSSIARHSHRQGVGFDKQAAMRAHREMIDAYEMGNVMVHMLPIDEATPLQVFARDSSCMTPYGAVVRQLANPRRSGEHAGVLRFYLGKDIPIYDLVTAGHFEGGDLNLIEPGAVLIGYVKPVTVEDKPACAEHAASSTVIAVLPNRDVAVAAIRQNDLEPVSVHQNLHSFICRLWHGVAHVSGSPVVQATMDHKGCPNRGQPYLAGHRIDAVDGPQSQWVLIQIVEALSNR